MSTTHGELSNIRLLVRELYDAPDDEDKASVVVDFLHRVGFDEIAEQINRKDVSIDHRRIVRHAAICSLRVLFGEGSLPIDESRYNVLLGFPFQPLIPGEITIVETQSQVFFAMKKLLIPHDVGRVINVHDLKIGKRSYFAGTDPIPGEVFGSSRPDMLRQVVSPMVSVSLTVTNIWNAQINFRGCILGVSKEWDAQALQDKQVDTDNKAIADLYKALDRINTETKERMKFLEAMLMRQFP